MCWWYSQAMYLWDVVGCDNTREPTFFILKKKIKKKNPSRASLKIVELLVFFSLDCTRSLFFFVIKVLLVAALSFFPFPLD